MSCWKKAYDALGRVTDSLQVTFRTEILGVRLGLGLIIGVLAGWQILRLVNQAIHFITG